MNKHVSITGFHSGTEVTIWRGDDLSRTYVPTRLSLLRITLFLQLHNIAPSVHIGNLLSCWFDYPEEEG